MSSSVKLNSLLAVLGLVVAYSNVGLAKDPKEMELSTDLIGFQVVGDPKAVVEFRMQFALRKDKTGVLGKYCTDPIDPRHLLDHERRLIFVCEAVPIVFTETGEVFLAAAPAKSPRPELEMDVATSTQCPGKKCNHDGSTDCLAYFPPLCYHRGHAGDSLHLCQ
jgi:hypothetical protein